MRETLTSDGRRRTAATPTPVSAREQSSEVPAQRRSFFARHQTIINFWLDTVLLVCFALLAWVSVVVQFIFPPAEAAAGYTLWGLSLSQFMDLQFGILAFFFFGIVLHLMLHWSWVCGVIGSRLLRSDDGKKRVMDDGQRTIFGVALMIVLLNVMGLGIAIAALSMQAPY